MSGLFLLSESGQLTALAPAAYDSEDALQRLIEQHHDLLAGDQMGSGLPRQWLFVAREAPVPDSLAGPGRWAMDHLFLDQEAIPTFVEVKRATDSRLRREVIGQMLDYAANGLRYLPVESIQALLAKNGDTAEAQIRQAFGADLDAADYWQQLRNNLAAGKIRLLFVADRIPSELLAVVEFLNTQMQRAEVLAIEIPQFVGDGGERILSPRVLGQTQAAIQQKQADRRPSRCWDEPTYFEAIDVALSPQDARSVRHYHRWIQAQGWRVVFGKGTVNGSLSAKFLVAGKECGCPVTCYSNGDLEFGFANLSPPFDTEAMRRQLIRRLNAIPGADFSEDVSSPGNKYPRRRIAILSSEPAFTTFTNALLWYAAELQAHAGQGTA